MCLCVVNIFHLDRGYSFHFLQPCAYDEKCENGICVPGMYSINYNYSYIQTGTKGNVILYL